MKKSFVALAVCVNFVAVEKRICQFLKTYIKRIDFWMDQSTDVGRDESSRKPLHKCPKCDRTFGNIGHMKCHFYRVHPEFKLAEFEVPETVLTPRPKPQQPEQVKQPQPKPEKQPPRQPEEVKPAPPPVVVPLNKIQQMLSKCDTCNRCFTNKTSLLKHRVTVHGDQSGFECGTCDKSFPTAARLRNHEETHSKVHVPCLQCAKSPSRGRCNHKKKRYVCKVCRRGFLNRIKLRKHVLTHEEGLQCEDCDETFDLRSDLEEHARSHATEDSAGVPARDVRGRLVVSKEQPKEDNRLSCNICDKTFARKCNLARHAVIHKMDDGNRS